MTLGEAIKHAEEVAEEKENEGKLLCQSEGASIGCLTCAEEHRQLAEWLKELKDYKERIPSYEAGYNDAKREIALSGEYERAYERGKADAQMARWIPVSEELPKNHNQEVLISLEWGIDIGRYSDGEWHSEWINHYDDGNVLAWMPLPASFEPEPQESDHKCHNCKHYTSGEYDGSCGSYICKEYSNWESEGKG